MKFNIKKFSEEQLKVINDTSRCEKVFEELTIIVSNDEFTITRKRCLLFQELIRFMKQRKQEFLNVGIKNNIADSLVKKEINALELATKELKNVVKKDN